MTREEARDLLISAGVAEPTDEAISNLLNKHNAEVSKQKAIADKYKSDATKVAELEKQLEELNDAKLSDIELAKKETEKSNSRVAELEKQIALMQRKTDLAAKGIVGEQADKLIREDGSLDIEILGQIISERETTAKSQLEKDLLNKTPNPKGGNGSNGDKTTEDALAEAIGKSMAGESKSTNDIVASYL